MLDRILNFLFRKKIGVLVVIASMCAVAFTMTGCFGWSMLSCFCGGLDCEGCEEVFKECDETFSCDTGCAPIDCAFGYGCEKDCGDCTVTCGGCNSTMCTEGDMGCGGGSCNFLNYSCTEKESEGEVAGESGCGGCSDDVYDGYYQIRIYYSRIINGKEEGSSKSFIVTTDKVFKDDKPPKSYTLNVSDFYNDTYYELVHILDGNDNDRKVKVNEDGDFTLNVSDYSEWKSGVQTHDLPGSYKVFLNEKCYGKPVNIYLGYAGIDKEGNFIENGIDRETEFKTTVNVGATLSEGAFTAPTIEGYTFKGYYYASISNKKAEKADIANIMGMMYNIEESSSVREFAGSGKDFHLSSYGIKPTDETLEFTVIAVYEEIKSDVYVRIIKNGQLLPNYSQIGWGLKYDYKLSELRDDVVAYKNRMEGNVLAGAKFFGWSTNENGSDIKSSIDTLASSNIKINADTTVYLFYKTKAQIVLHNYEKPNVGIKTIPGEGDSDLYYGDSYTLPTTLPKNGRFTFEGWYKDAALTQPVDYYTIKLSDSTTNIYAKWKEQTKFTVKYYASRDYYDSNNEQYSADYYRNEDLILHGSDKVVTPSRYTFAGWFVLDESGNKLNDNPVTKLTKQTYECNLSLIAAYSIDVKLVYGANAYDRTVYYQESCELQVPTTTDNSKEFDGWFTKSTGGVRVSEKDGSVEAFNVIFETVGGNFLYATWATKTFKVSFYQYNSTTCEPKTVEYNGTVTAPVADARTGYTFKGWFTAKEGGTEFDPTAPVTSDKTYYAQYAPNKYTITFVIDGTTWKTDGDTDVCVYVYYDQKATLPKPMDTGKYFVGWYYNGKKFTEDNGEMLSQYNETKDITLVAVFA